MELLIEGDLEPYHFESAQMHCTPRVSLRADVTVIDAGRFAAALGGSSLEASATWLAGHAVAQIKIAFRPALEATYLTMMDLPAESAQLAPALVAAVNAAWTELGVAMAPPSELTVGCDDADLVRVAEVAINKVKAEMAAEARTAAPPDGQHTLGASDWVQIEGGRPVRYGSLGQYVPGAAAAAAIAERIRAFTGQQVRFGEWEIEPGDPRDSGRVVALIVA